MPRSLLVALLLPLAAQAQGPVAVHAYLAASGLDGEATGALGVGLAFRAPAPGGLATFRGATILDDPPLLAGDLPIERNVEVAVLYGPSLQLGRLPAEPGGVTASAAVGVGAMHALRRGALIQGGGVFSPNRYERVGAWAVGLAYEGRAELRREQGGLVVGLFGNYNRVDPFIGVLAGIFFGGGLNEPG